MMALVHIDEAYAASHADLVRFATALVGRDDALDVVSEAVASTLQAGRLESIDDLRAYWFRAVANRAASWHRASFRRGDRERRASRTTSGSPSADGDDWITPDAARQLLGGLTSQQRAAIYLTYWHDMDPATVAATLGVSEGTIRKQLARGRAHLREVMANERR